MSNKNRTEEKMNERVAIKLLVALYAFSVVLASTSMGKSGEEIVLHSEFVLRCYTVGITCKLMRCFKLHNSGMRSLAHNSTHNSCMHSLTTRKCSVIKL